MKTTQIFNWHELTPALLEKTAQALKQGALAILPTDTVYGIATGAFCEESIAEICRLKNRSQQQPLQFLMSGTERVHDIAVFSPQAEKLAQAYWPGALTMILPATPEGKPLLRGFNGLGIRVPAMPVLQQMLMRLEGPLACTSANEHGKPVLTSDQDLVELFEGKVDFIFKGGTLSPISSSVVDLTADPRLLRAGALSKEKLEQAMGCSLIA